MASNQIWLINYSYNRWYSHTQFISRNAQRFTAIRKARSLILIKIPPILANISGTKSTGNSKICILGIRGLRQVLTLFNPFLTHRHSSIRRESSLNFNYILHRLTDIFDSKYRIHTWGLNSCSPILIIFSYKLARLKDILPKFYPDAFIGL